MLTLSFCVCDWVKDRDQNGTHLTVVILRRSCSQVCISADASIADFLISSPTCQPVVFFLSSRSGLRDLSTKMEPADVLQLGVTTLLWVDGRAPVALAGGDRSG